VIGGSRRGIPTEYAYQMSRSRSGHGSHGDFGERKGWARQVPKRVHAWSVKKELPFGRNAP
jgi:hypothetical protein